MEEEAVVVDAVMVVVEDKVEDTIAVQDHPAKSRVTKSSSLHKYKARQ